MIPKMEGLHIYILYIYIYIYIIYYIIYIYISLNAWLEDYSCKIYERFSDFNLRNRNKYYVTCALGLYLARRLYHIIADKRFYDTNYSKQRKCFLKLVLLNFRFYNILKLVFLCGFSKKMAF